MFLIFLIKNMCLMAFYFAYATLFVHKSMTVVYFIVIACFSLSYFLSYNEKYSKLKYLPVLGVFLAILYMKTITGAIAALFPFVYMIFFVKNDEYYVNYDFFRDLFAKLILAILALMLVVFIIDCYELFKNVSLQYVIIFLLSGLYLLRCTRHSEEVIKSKKFAIMNILIISLVCVICLILSSNIAINAIIYVLKLFYNKVFMSVIVGLSYGVMGIAWLFMQLMFLIADHGNGTSISGETAEEVEKAEELTNIIANNEPFFMFLQIIVCAIIVLLCIYLLKKFSANQKKRQDDDLEGVRQYRSFLTDNNKVNKKNIPLIKNSVNQIRYWYRKFLLLCYRRKVDVGIFDSSQSIHDKSSDVFVNSIQELESIREIYRKARYSKENIDSQDVKKFKNIYKKLENEKIESKIPKDI